MNQNLFVHGIPSVVTSTSCDLLRVLYSLAQVKNIFGRPEL